MVAIDLVPILKGDEGKEFYSPCFGPVKLKEVSQYKIKITILSGSEEGTEVWLNTDGTYNKGYEVMIYPSKLDRDWELYHYIKLYCPGWNEYVKETGDIIVFNSIDLSNTQFDNKIDLSAIAYIKICKIIQYFYNKNKTLPTIGIDSHNHIQYYSDSPREYWPLMFQTSDDALNFLKNPENIKLINQYYNLK